MSVDSGSQKRALRADLRERRRRMTVTDRESAADSITANLATLVSSLGAKSVSAYLSMPDEPPTRKFIAGASSRGIRILLPVSRVDGRLDWVLYDASAESADHLGMPITPGDVLHPTAIEEVDLMLVPAASVDRTGLRMGWGRGYFDRMLGSMVRRPPVYAVIFDDEFVDSVPGEAHDQRVDGVVTPSGITKF